MWYDLFLPHTNITMTLIIHGESYVQVHDTSAILVSDPHIPFIIVILLI